MSRFNGKTWFLASCVELYKTAKGMSGREAFSLLDRSGAVAFITDCWESLHTTSPDYIVASIDEFIHNHSKCVK